MPNKLQTCTEPALGRLQAEDGQGGVKLLAGLVRRESLTMAYNDIWLLIAGLFGMMLLLLPAVRSVNRRRNG